MKNNGMVIAQLGNNQKVFSDRQMYPRELLKNYVENIISFNASELSRDSGKGRMRIVSPIGRLILQISVAEGIFSMSDESMAIVLVCLEGSKLKSYANYGVDCIVDFTKNPSGSLNLSSPDDLKDSVKHFHNSYDVKKGSLASSLIIVDNVDVFRLINNDSYFDDCFVFCCEN